MNPPSPPSPLPSPRRRDRDSPANSRSDASSPIAHTLTACCRCRLRKSRCDTGLPRCGPCERSNQHCEYFDPAKGIKIPRYYVVHLQHKVLELEKQLEALECDDLDEPDVEDVVRGGAVVRIQEHDESKFLGPSSGIAITRLVMQLAKRFTQSGSITDIVDENKAQEIKNTFAQEEDKPDSKIYPHISDIPAMDLPERQVTGTLVDFFNLRVMTMYPFLHEQTLWQDVNDVFNGSTDPFQNFEVRMVIANALQRAREEWAGLADSFYLAALQYFEDAVKPMNVRTIQCFCLIGAYSLLTPTRTAVYYVVGLATRLIQALGLAEEKTIGQGSNGQPANPLEIDMRRRLFWSVLSMEYGLAHSMGRASCFATQLEHFDVGWFEIKDDKYITPEGIDPSAPRSLKKWIVLHFFKMRLLQLEIRRKLYQKKRPEPKDENDPWFIDMERRLVEWRDVTPDTEAGKGLDKAWFVGRYHTMVVMLFRPSPQCPKPSLAAAQRCWVACRDNIYMHKRQMEVGNVDTTWIFTQAMFMNVNTILWALSFEPVRLEYSRAEVERDLNVALTSIKVASFRWPGVESALELYNTLIPAYMRIYDQRGDVDGSVGSPADTAAGYDSARSDTASPVAQAARGQPPATGERGGGAPALAPPVARAQPTYVDFSSAPAANGHATAQRQYLGAAAAAAAAASDAYPAAGTAPLFPPPPSNGTGAATTFDANGTPQMPLPSAYDGQVKWESAFDVPALSPYDGAAAADAKPAAAATTASNTGAVPALWNNAAWTDCLHAPWAAPAQVARNSSAAAAAAAQAAPGGAGDGLGALDYAQYVEMMNSLRDTGTGFIQSMVDATNAVFYPPGSIALQR